MNSDKEFAYNIERAIRELRDFIDDATEEGLVVVFHAEKYKERPFQTDLTVWRKHEDLKLDIVRNFVICQNSDQN